jgi:phosphatidylglycerol lysyltransferase
VLTQDVPRARALVMRYGWNATAYQFLNPGIEHWFSGCGDAVIGFVCRHGVRVVAGAPVCDEDRLADVVAEWEQQVLRARDGLCYFGAAGRMKALLDGSPGYSTVVLGAQPVWSPSQWPDIIARHASLRAQLSRARNKGVSVSEWPSCAATNHPNLHDCLQDWLKTRGLPPLHFLVEPQTLAHLQDRRIFVAERGGGVVGFLIGSPVPARDGWLTEQFVRCRDAPNGTVELLLDSMVRAVAVEGARYLTMGLVPLAAGGGVRLSENPPWLRFLLAWVRAHGRRFYNFRGLEAFKSKFHPREWEPIYAVSREPRFSPHTLYAIAAAFTDGSPVAAVARGLARAARQELRWLFEREAAVK